VDTRKLQLRTVCDKRLYAPITPGSFEAKISIDIQQTFFLFFFFVTLLASLRTQFLLPTFYVFFRVISKKRKKSCLFEIWKKRKIRILEHCSWHYYKAWFVVCSCKFICVRISINRLNLSHQMGSTTNKMHQTFFGRGFSRTTPYWDGDTPCLPRYPLTPLGSRLSPPGPGFWPQVV